MAKEKTVQLRALAYIDFGNDKKIAPGQKFNCPEDEMERLVNLGAAEHIAKDEETPAE